MTQRFELAEVLANILEDDDRLLSAHAYDCLSQRYPVVVFRYLLIRFSSMPNPFWTIHAMTR